MSAAIKISIIGGAAAFGFLALGAAPALAAATITKVYPNSGAYSWAAPADVSQVTVTVIGGGGGGGGSNQTSYPCGGDSHVGGGGGSGGVVKNQAMSVTPGHIYPVVVGTGGTGGFYFCNYNAERPGINGTASSFDGITAGGGQGGSPGANFAGGVGGIPGGVAGQNSQPYCQNQSQAAGGDNGTGHGAGGSTRCLNPGGAGQDGYVSITYSSSLVSLTPSPASVPAGGASTLSWATSDLVVPSCTIKDQGGNTLMSQAPAKTVFDYTGGDQTYPVPNGVNELFVKLWGASAGNGSSPFLQDTSKPGGGAGGYTAGALPVSPGQTYTIIVGQGGNNQGTTYGGGGAGIGGQYNYDSAAGRSAVRLGGTELLTAGGGPSSNTYVSNSGVAAGGGLSGFVGGGQNYQGDAAQQGPAIGARGGGGGYFGGVSGVFLAGDPNQQYLSYGGTGYCDPSAYPCTTASGSGYAQPNAADPDNGGAGTGGNPTGSPGRAVVYAGAISGSVSTGALNAAQTYTLSCSDFLGDSDTVSAQVSVGPSCPYGPAEQPWGAGSYLLYPSQGGHFTVFGVNYCMVNYTGNYIFVPANSVGEMNAFLAAATAVGVGYNTY